MVAESMSDDPSLALNGAEKRSPVGQAGLHRDPSQSAVGGQLHLCADWSGMAFTTFVSDVFSRRIVGWRTSSSTPTELPLNALEMALWTRSRAGEPVDGVVHHSDARSQ